MPGDALRHAKASLAQHPQTRSSLTPLHIRAQFPLGTDAKPDRTAAQWLEMVGLAGPYLLVGVGYVTPFAVSNAVSFPVCCPGTEISLLLSTAENDGCVGQRAEGAVILPGLSFDVLYDAPMPLGLGRRMRGMSERGCNRLRCLRNRVVTMEVACRMMPVKLRIG